MTYSNDLPPLGPTTTCNFNNDNRLDILSTSSLTGKIWIFLGIGDFDNNRKLDFAVSKEDADNLKILQTC